MLMFMLRVTFWIMLILLILPGSRDDNLRLISSAEKTVSDVRGFCGRNPDVCEDARGAMTTLFAKVKNGTQTLERMLATPDEQEKSISFVPVEEKSQVRLAPHRAAPQQYEAAPRWGNSLNPGDRQPPWRGPAGL